MSYALFKRLNLKKDESVKRAVLITITSCAKAFRSDEVTIMHPWVKIPGKTHCYVADDGRNEYFYIFDLLIEQLCIKFFIQPGSSAYQILTVIETENNTVIKVKETVDGIIDKSDVTDFKEQKEVKVLLTDYPQVI